MPLRFVNKSHTEDFANMLQIRGLLMDDFELRDSPTQLAATGGAYRPTINTITVRSRRTGTERQYEARPGRLDGGVVAWVNDAAVDIDAGVFGQ
jgi:hypothetical protein